MEVIRVNEKDRVEGRGGHPENEPAADAEAARRKAETDRILEQHPGFERTPPEERTPEGVTEVILVPRLLGRERR